MRFGGWGKRGIRRSLFHLSGGKSREIPGKETEAPPVTAVEREEKKKKGEAGLDGAW